VHGEANGDLSTASLTAAERMRDIESDDERSLSCRVVGCGVITCLLWRAASSAAA
jgi:hypothetical protein